MKGLCGFLQCYNELEKNNLIRCITQMKRYCERIVCYDDGSNDGSYEYLQKNCDLVIRGETNEFGKELEHKNKLLEEAKKQFSDIQFFIWLDADEVVDEPTHLILSLLCQKMIELDACGLAFHEENLWRSDCWKRVDELWNMGFFVRLWCNHPDLKFNVLPGLHKPQYPTIEGKQIFSVPEARVIHYGFATKEAIVKKYLTYKNHGQTGRDLDRLIDENGLKTELIPAKWFPPGLRPVFVIEAPKPLKPDKWGV